VSSRVPRWLPIYLGVGVIWGCSFWFIKEGLGFLSVGGVAFARSSLGALTLLIGSRVTSTPLPRSPRVWGLLAVNGLLMNVVPALLFPLAETRATSVLAGLMNALTPLSTIFFLTLVFRDERLTRDQRRGLGLGLLGVLVVLGVWHGLGHNPWWAIVALLLAVTCYGVSFPFTRRYLTPLKLPPMSMATGQLVTATLALSPALLWHPHHGGVPSMGAILAVLALGAGSSGLAYVWNFHLIERAGSAIASTTTYLTPVVAVAVGALLLHERVTWNEPVGGTLVLLAAAWGQGWLTRRRPVV
jgi:drug/metabolite transporter (DMT)-like permease